NTWGAALSLDFIYVATDNGLHTFGLTPDEGQSFDSTIAQSIDVGTAAPIIADDGTLYVSNPTGLLVAYSPGPATAHALVIPGVAWQTPGDQATILSAPGQTLKVSVAGQGGSAFNGTVTFTSNRNGI